MNADQPQPPLESSTAPWIVSACLLGRPCRYDGASQAHASVLEESRHRSVIAVCPEELGGLGTPRPPAELRGGDGEAVWRGQARVERVQDNVDVTQAFIQGAEKAELLCVGATKALLKSRSPSCGVGQTHIDGEIVPGDGVFTALLRRRGIEVFDEDTFSASQS